VHGLFENLHDFPNSAQFAKHLAGAAKTYYGTPARAFIAAVLAIWKNKGFYQARRAGIHRWPQARRQEMNGPLRCPAAKTSGTRPPWSSSPMLTLFSYPDLYGVADNNPYGLKVYAFLKLCKLAFRHEHILDTKNAPRGQLPYLFRR
jgi:hypothetical protein